MNIFSWFPFRTRRPERAAGRSSKRSTVRPQLEEFENRLVPSGNTISGFVFRDANNNGIFDSGEQAIANSPIELRNASNVVVGSTITDANGRYEFATDNTANTEPKTIEQTITIPTTVAGFSIDKLIQQFDPSKGELLSVEIINEGSISSDIKVENLVTLQGATINGTVQGTFTLTGSGFTLTSQASQNAGTFNAGAYDGNIDFTGASGKSFPSTTATASPKSITLTGSALTAYKGTGTVSFTEKVDVSSTTSGGGNLVIGISSNADAKITVRYNYRPSADLQPGNYTIIQKEQPLLGTDAVTRYLDGLESKAGAVLPGTVGTDVIQVTLSTTNLVNNNFGEVAPASLGGNVYLDANNDGIKGSGENGIQGVTVVLSGTNDLGQTVDRAMQTLGDGSYLFANLRPGTYAITEQPATGYVDGKDTLGDATGTAGNDVFTSIALQAGVNGRNYNFGELLNNAGLSGTVYEDTDNDGVQDPGEAGIAGVKVTLTGSTPSGPVTLERTTDFNGNYSFGDLPLGTYAITETQANGYGDGKDTPGTRSGTQITNDKIENIVLLVGQTGTGYNFGERIIADVAIAKSVAPTTALAGSSATYTLTVTNNGPSTAQGVVVQDTLPAGVVYLGSTAPGWTVSIVDNVLTYRRDSFASGASSTITIQARAPLTAGTYDNVTVVSSSTPDSNLTNNSATARLTVAPIIISDDPPILPPEDPSKQLLLTSSTFWRTIQRRR